MINRVVRPAVFLCLFGSIVLTGCTSSPAASSSTPTTPTAPTAPVAAPPTVTSLAPATIPAGAASTTVTVAGTGFTSKTAIQVNGALEPTTFVSATQLTVAVSASQLAQGSLLSIVAVDGDLNSASGPPVNLEVDNPTPVIAAIVPAAINTGAISRSVAITGSGFVPSTAIQLAGSARSSSYSSPNLINVILTSADLASAGTLSLTAINPAPAGGTSAAASLAINNAAPSAFISLSPAIVTTGASTPATITVTGTNFLPSSVVQIAGLSRPTTYVSATQLTFQISVAEQASAATFSITVATPAPGGGTSRPATLAVAAPTLTAILSSVQPTQFIVGSPDSLLTVNGTNLGPNSVVQWNGIALATFYNFGFNGTFLSAQVPANLLAAVGTSNITVTSPTAPAVSNSLPVSVVTPPAPTLTLLSPSSAPINTSSMVTLSGTGFTQSSTVAFNGTSLPDTFVDAQTLTVTLPASSVALPGNGSFTVTTAAPGGGTTAPLVFTSYIALVNNSMVYNPVNGLFYVSVPSSAGAPYGNSIVSVDPETGALGTPIAVGSEPNKLALTSDGSILWVGLDGASAVRQVNLTTNTAGLQFSLGNNQGISNTPPTALALAALPGAPNSVVVSSSVYAYAAAPLSIYDNGIQRGSSAPQNSQFNTFFALQVNGTTSEIYAASNFYDTFTYSSNGLTLKNSTTEATNYASISLDDIQIANGILYTDFGTAFGAESGTLLGTFYTSGSTPASGPTVVDSAQGKAFILDNSSGQTFSSYNQIQVFNTSDYNQTTAAVIPLSVNTTTTNFNAPSADRLTRWGTNGLAFRVGAGIYSLRSNLVKDLSSTSADLGVTLAATGTNTTGANTTYTATITNSGPADGTNVALTATLPSTGVLVSASPSIGSCSTTNGVSCDLGSLTNGASATVTFVVQQTTAGSAALTVQVSGSENDPVQTNNQATSSPTITGETFNLAPTLTSISPAAIATGAPDTVITVTGVNFSPASTVQLGATTLQTTYVSSTSLTATVPAASVATLGWGAVTVTSPAPGGGISAPLPLSFFTVLNAGVNDILYEPFSRKIYASVGSSSTAVTGNSVAAITPETATIGAPVNVGSQPTKLALSDDGNILYVVLGGANSVARFNLQTQQTEFSFTPTAPNFSVQNGGFLDIAVQTNSENTIALDFGYASGLALFDIDPATRTATIRQNTGGIYSGTSLHFYNPQTLYLYNTDTLNYYTVDANGLNFNYNQNSSSLINFSAFQLVGSLAFANAGGVADISTSPATQVGVYKPLVSPSFNQVVAADPSLQSVFFLASTSPLGSNPDGIVTYKQTTFLPSSAISLNLPTVEGNNQYSGIDLVRWGQDGLAALTSSGHVYLLRGAAVVPELFTQNSAAILTSSSSTSTTHGAGNTLLTLTGTNFIPGVAVQWNGAYRTTTIVDPTHLSVAIPASDLATAGSAALTIVNPNAPASAPLTFTIN